MENSSSHLFKKKKKKKEVVRRDSFRFSFSYITSVRKIRIRNSDFTCREGVGQSLHFFRGGWWKLDMYSIALWNRLSFVLQTLLATVLLFSYITLTLFFSFHCSLRWAFSCPLYMYTHLRKKYNNAVNLKGADEILADACDFFLLFFFFALSNGTRVTFVWGLFSWRY